MELFENHISFFIPDPLWQQIFSYFNSCEFEFQTNLSNFRLVCKRFRELISPFWSQRIKLFRLEEYLYRFHNLASSIRLLSISSSPQYVLQLPQSFKTMFSCLKELSIHDALGDEDVKYFPTSLRKLVFVRNSISAVGLSYLPSSVNNLIFALCSNIENESLKYLTTSIEKLTLAGSNITDVGLTFLPKSIKDITLIGSLRITDEGLRFLAENFPFLQSVSFIQCRLIRGDCFRYFHPCIVIKFGSLSLNPFLASIYFENMESIRYFVETYGVDVNQKLDGKTPLHFACIYYFRLPIIKYLLQHGADINQIDNEGKTVFHLACEKGEKEIVEYFLEVLLLQRDSLQSTEFNILDQLSEFPISCYTNTIQRILIEVKERLLK